jgi:hypothetical protein
MSRSLSLVNGEHPVGCLQFDDDLILLPCPHFVAFVVQDPPRDSPRRFSAV